jgi:hypothetical protein
MGRLVEMVVAVAVTLGNSYWVGYVKVVQHMLGHASATMTMDTYGHLFHNRLDEVADAMDAARAAAQDLARESADAQADPAVARVLPSAQVIDLARARRRGKTPGQRGNSRGAPGRIRTCAPASGGRCSIP